MPREIRTLKRSSFTDEKVCSVPREVRWTWQGLIANADDYGRLRADVRLLKAAIYPLDDDITSADVSADIHQLEHAGLVRRYDVDGVRYLELPGFEKHQKMARKYGSDIPAPVDAVRTQCASGALGVCAQGANTAGEERSGEGAEKERSGEAGPSIRIAPVPELDRPRPPDELASLLESLPRNAQQVMATFYEPAFTDNARERYRNVISQLYDTLASNHPGPKIRGGQRVKARSAEHLDDVCAAVLRDPPMNRDAAIVFVLQKLLDPPKGPSVTDMAKRNDARDRSLEDTYQREAKAAGIAWATEHPDDYAPILAKVEATYRGKTGAFVAGARESELVQLCAKACGFPTFNAWLRDRRCA